MQVDWNVLDNIVTGAGIVALVSATIWKLYRLVRSVEEVVVQARSTHDDLISITSRLDKHIAEQTSDSTIVRDEFREVAMRLNEITREIRPNGGSSMKDVLNEVAMNVRTNGARLAALEQWRNETGPIVTSLLTSRLQHERVGE